MTVVTNTNKCPNCGAEMVFDVEKGMLVCQHCGHIQMIENANSVERRELTGDIMRKKDKWTDGHVFRCQNCGSKEVLTGRDVSTRCSFCGSNNVVAVDDLCGLRPDSVVPFQVTKERAREIFVKWLKKSKMAPADLKTADVREQINQIYCPTWSFSANTYTDYNGVLGKNITVTRRQPNGQTTSHTEVRYFNVSGSISHEYHDYILQSSSQISPINFNRLKPFDLDGIKPYRSEYLAGIRAEQYTKDLDVCFMDFQNLVQNEMRQKIKFRHGADTIQRLNLNTKYENKKFNYILLPLYIATYTYKKKLFNFFINGISGKIVGKHPTSWIKVLLVGLGVASLMCFVGYFYWRYRM